MHLDEPVYQDGTGVVRERLGEVCAGECVAQLTSLEMDSKD